MTRSSARRATASRPPARSARPPKRSPTTMIAIGVVALVLVAAIGLAIARNVGRNVGEKFPDQGVGLHLANAEDTPPVDWNSDPPTSGYHWGGGTAPWGIFNEPIGDTFTVHNLEHGGIVIHYRQGIDQPTLDQLTGLGRELLRQNQCLVMIPRAEPMDAPIIVTAWTYMLKLESFDAAAIREFFQAHIGRGPEAVCTP